MENFKFIDTLDCSELKLELSNLDENVWWHNTSRQDSFPVHEHTTSIILKDFPNNWDGHGYPITNYEFENSTIVNITNSIVSKLETLYNGKVGKVIFARLHPERMITPHVDAGYYLSNCRRCHLSIKTNDFVHFFAGQEWFIFDEGDLYELNNNVMHSVVNYSKDYRIHLIIDIIPNSSFLS